MTLREALVWADEFAGPDFCHICGRCTDHRGEHSKAQLIDFVATKGKMFR